MFHQSIADHVNKLQPLINSTNSLDWYIVTFNAVIFQIQEKQVYLLLLTPLKLLKLVIDLRAALY